MIGAGAGEGVPGLALQGTAFTQGQRLDQPELRRIVQHSGQMLGQPLTQAGQPIGPRPRVQTLERFPTTRIAGCRNALLEQPALVIEAARIQRAMTGLETDVDTPALAGRQYGTVAIAGDPNPTAEIQLAPVFVPGSLDVEQKARSVILDARNRGDLPLDDQRRACQRIRKGIAQPLTGLEPGPDEAQREEEYPEGPRPNPDQHGGRRQSQRPQPPGRQCRQQIQPSHAQREAQSDIEPHPKSHLSPYTRVRDSVSAAWERTPSRPLPSRRACRTQ